MAGERTAPPRLADLAPGRGWRFDSPDTRTPDVWVGAFLPWPSLVAEPGNLLTRCEGYGMLAPRHLDRDNLLTRQNLQIAAVRHGTAPRGAVQAPHWIQAEDVEFRPHGGGRGPQRPRTTMRALFAAFRARGLQPHSHGPENDGYVAARMLRGRFSAMSGSTPESTTPPNPALGLAEGAWARESAGTADGAAAIASGTFQEVVIGTAGTASEMAADVRAMGAGRARRLKQSDITYACVFPTNELLGSLFLYGARVPKPLELLNEMRVDSTSGTAFGRLTPMNDLIISCFAAASPLKLDLTPFNGGGGITTNYTGAEGQGNTDYIPETEDATGEPTGTIRWGTVAPYLPEWQSGCLIPSGYGWDPWYYDPAEITAPMVGIEEGYQRFALNVFPTEAGPVKASEYAHQAARRKCLAVAAFAQGIGEWLMAVDVALGGTSGGPASVIYDVVDTIELGNELDGFWVGSAVPPGVGPGVLEPARLMALIAGPIHALLPDMRFRTELLSWHRPNFADTAATSFPEQSEWLRQIVHRGIPNELAWWRRVQAYQARLKVAELLVASSSPPVVEPDPPVDAWLATCADAGWQWPPQVWDDADLVSLTPPAAAAVVRNASYTYAAPAASDLLHQAGFHWYHYTDTNLSGSSDLVSYADTNALARDVATLASLTGLSVTVGEIGFPAHDPGLPPSGAWASGYYAGTSPRFQAAMHLRLLATVLAAGAASATLFTFNFGQTPSSTPYGAGYTFSQWRAFYTHGVHNDVLGSDRTTYRQEQDCWPRATWFAFRRFSWLRSQASSITTVYAERGCTILQLTFATPLTTGPDGAALTTSWSYAYLLWLDQYADQPSIQPPAYTGALTIDLAFTDPDGTAYELLSVVPDVAVQVSPEGPFEAGRPTYLTDDQGYCAIHAPSGTDPSNPDWAWSGWDAALSATSVVIEAAAFSFTLLAAAPTAAKPQVIAPICLLTNATFSGAA